MAKNKSKGIKLYEEIKKDLLSGPEFMKNMLQQQLQSAEWQTSLRYLDRSLMKDLVLVQTNESEETAHAQ